MAALVIAVVGPSGAGKDTLIAALQAARPGLRAARRVITRPEQAGGEPFEGVSEAVFAQREAEGAFALCWDAHGLRYGIPRAALEEGAVLVNLSRKVLAEAQARFAPRFVVLNVTASPAILAKRLAGRGREDEEDIAARIARADTPLPAGLPAVGIDNGGALEDSLAQAVAAIDAARERVGHDG